MKLLIIGSVANGKTTLAYRLSEKYSIPIISLDKIVYDEENNKRDMKDQVKLLNTLLNNKEWIVEGTLRKQFNYLLDQCDTLIYLRLPKWVQSKRIITRYIKQKLHIENYLYPPSLKGVKELFHWAKQDRKKEEEFLKMLEKYNLKMEKGKTIV